MKHLGKISLVKHVNFVITNMMQKTVVCGTFHNYSTKVCMNGLGTMHPCYSNKRHSSVVSYLCKSKKAALLYSSKVYVPKLYSTDSQNKNDEPSTDTLEKHSKFEKTGKLAKVFAEFGTTAVLFHTTISLTTLSISYTLVSSGIDVVALLQKYNLITEVTTEAKIAGGASTFVIAYACHKVFMPVRIFLTVTCTPVIVKKLRSIGILKAPPSNK